MKPIKNPQKFISLLKSEKNLTIRYKKKDGTSRNMKCTLDFDQIPKQFHPKSLDMKKIRILSSKYGIVHVFDTDKKGWRSVIVDRIEWIKTPSGEKTTVDITRSKMKEFGAKLWDKIKSWFKR